MVAPQVECSLVRLVAMQQLGYCQLESVTLATVMQYFFSIVGMF